MKSGQLGGRTSADLVNSKISFSARSSSHGWPTVKRLKNSMKTLQRVPVTNGSQEFELCLTEMAKAAGPRERVFPLSRRRRARDQFMKRYCRLAGIHCSKAHFHSFKHSIAMAIWAETKQSGQIKSYLGTNLCRARCNT
jgi:hypothetical protein